MCVEIEFCCSYGLGDGGEVVFEVICVVGVVFLIVGSMFVVFVYLIIFFLGF